MMIRRTVNSFFSNGIIGNGIFSEIYKQDQTIPFITEDNKELLDISYHGNFSGMKTASPMLVQLGLNDGNNISELSAKVILNMFKNNWIKLYEAFMLEYNPIHNYDMTEHENVSGTNEGTAENTETIDTATDTTSHDTHTFEHGRTETTDYGKESKTVQRGKVEDVDSDITTTTYGKTDSITRDDHTDTLYGKTDTLTHGMKVVVNDEQSESHVSTKTDTTTYGKVLDTTNSETTEQSGNSTETNTISAYNSAGWENDTKRDVTNSSNTTVNGTSNETASGSDKVTGTFNDTVAVGDEKTETHSGDDVTATSGTDTVTKNETVKDTLSGTDKESHDITRARDTENAETVSDSGADSLKVTGTDTEDTNGTIKVKDSGTVSNSETTSNNSNTDRFLTRSGNVGVTTTQRCYFRRWTFAHSIYFLTEYSMM